MNDHQHLPHEMNKVTRSPMLLVGVIVGVLVLAGVLVGVFFLGGKKDPQPAATQPAEPKPTPVILEGPAVAVQANEMVTMYKDKQAEAAQTYDGKVVDVTGIVFGKTEDLAGTRAIALEGGVQHFAGVRCVFPPANYFQLSELEQGETVTIRGRVEGLVSNVILRDCAVLKREGGQ